MGYYGNTIQCRRGDTTSITIVLKNSAGVAINITGYTIWFTVKPFFNSTDTGATIQKKATVFTDPTNGTHTYTLTNTDTTISNGNYVYDIQVKDTSSVITTPIVGDFEVLPEVTIGTS
jgi:hypothetical protein